MEFDNDSQNKPELKNDDVDTQVKNNSMKRSNNDVKIMEDTYAELYGDYIKEFNACL